MATPIKILPTTANVRSYSGAEADYSAREFIGQCEAVMQNASVTEPSDKIAFVKSNLQPGYMACKLMQSSMFWVPMENNDYKILGLVSMPLLMRWERQTLFVV